MFWLLFHLFFDLPRPSSPGKGQTSRPTARGVELKIVPEFTDQELSTKRTTRVTYWQGAVPISDIIGQKTVKLRRD